MQVIDGEYDRPVGGGDRKQPDHGAVQAAAGLGGIEVGHRRDPAECVGELWYEIPENACQRRCFDTEIGPPHFAFRRGSRHHGMDQRGERITYRRIRAAAPSRQRP